MGTGAEYVGLGFIIGIRYASIIMAGSILSFWVIIGAGMLAPLGRRRAVQAITPMIKDASAGGIFGAIPK